MRNLTQEEKESIARRADQMYDEKIKPLEAEFEGKIASVDLDTGDYEIADTPLLATTKLRERRPNGNFFAFRIGYDAVYAIGARLHRRSK